MKLFFNILYYVIVSGIIAVAGLLFVTMVPAAPGNLQAKVVKSGSMEPAIQTGALLVIAPAEVYAVGDVITFGPDTPTQIPTTHRIVQVTGTGASQMFTTQGDANEEPDPLPVALRDINGKVMVNVPYLGFILDFAKKPLGFALLVGVPAGAIILEELAKIIRELKNMRRNKLAHDTSATDNKRKRAST